MFQFKNTRIVFEALFLIVSVLLLLPGFYGPAYPGFYEPGHDVDFSWMLAINKAFQQKMIFGDDLFFTYGPLGFAATRTPYFVPGGAFLIYDLLFISISIYCFENIRKKMPFYWVQCIFIVLACFFSIAALHLDKVLVLPFLVIFLLKEGKPWQLITAGLISCSALFIKLNAGLFLIVLYPSAITFLAFNLKITVRHYLALITGFIGLFAISFLLLPVSVPGYIDAAWHLFSSYKDVMYMPPEPITSPLYLWAGVSMSLVFTFLCCFFLYRNYSGYNLFFILLTCLYLFLAFNASFVRIDYKHVWTFFLLIPLVLLLLMNLSGGKEKIINYFVISFILLSTAIVFRHPANWPLFSAKLAQLPVYFKAGSHEEIDCKESDVLPGSLKKIIGDKSINVLPKDLALIFCNHLNYKAGPAIQYFGWDPWSRKLNASYYESNTAPHFLIYGFRQIDDNFMMHEESLTDLAILRNYDITRRFKDFLFLEKRKTQVPWRKKTLRRGYLEMNKVYALPADSNILVINAKVEYSLWGKLMKLFFQPPPLKIALLTDESQWEYYRLSKPFIEGGIIINKNVQNVEDSNTFFTTAGTGNKGIKAIRIYSRKMFGFKSRFWFEISEEGKL